MGIAPFFFFFSLCERFWLGEYGVLERVGVHDFYMLCMLNCLCN